MNGPKTSGSLILAVSGKLLTQKELKQADRTLWNFNNHAVNKAYNLPFLFLFSRSR